MHKETFKCLKRSQCNSKNVIFIYWFSEWSFKVHWKNNYYQKIFEIYIFILVKQGKRYFEILSYYQICCVIACEMCHKFVRYVFTRLIFLIFFTFILVYKLFVIRFSSPSEPLISLFEARVSSSGLCFSLVQKNSYIMQFF